MKSFKDFINKKTIKYIVIWVLCVIFGLGIVYFYINSNRSVKNISIQTSNLTAIDQPSDETLNAGTNINETVVDQSSAPTIVEPPKRASAPTKQSSVTKTDGSRVETISDAPVDSSDLVKFSSMQNTGSTPFSIPFIDETGKYGSLESILKNYISSNLLWSSEISELKSIVVKNAGDTGWYGQYVGSYTVQPSGDITSAYGFIILNTYYFESSAQFNEYMKLVLSHEFGHHYTQYYKWVNYDLAVGYRFPDQYYSARPLSKATTTADCSSWSTCDSEIIAEDYSYFYSGYGLHAMASSFQYPSAATKDWLVQLNSQNVTNPVVKTVDNSPTIAIISPQTNVSVSGDQVFNVSASDDIGIVGVSYYVDGALVYTTQSSPYSGTIHTAQYTNGYRTIKVVVKDTAGQAAEASVVVLFDNAVSDNENPVLTLISPLPDSVSNIVAWTSGDLIIRATATDNQSVSKIEIYINDILAATENGFSIGRLWKPNNVPAGQYVIKIKAYDASGNTSEKNITIVKS